MQLKNKFYITTPIYYVTAAPHLGSLYSTIIADVAARWNRLLGKKVFMLTGTDEHGQKVAQAAAKAGKAPKEFVDSFIDTYQKTWNLFNIQYTDFIRTTDERHVNAVQHWILQMQQQGDIYKDYYTGWYCMPCESYVTAAEGAATPPTCPSCGRATESVSEESYFFRLSAYQDRLLEFFAQNKDFIIPSERMNEVINFVRDGLKDLSISRTSVSWGIPFPGDPKHTVYVWADALNNYITAIGYAQVGKLEEFEYWWPADAHILGKDIVRFHAVYWPAFLMATQLPMPKHLVVHGWITVNQQKMSKSFGNVVDPIALYHTYGADEVRYYLMRQMAITHDGDFSFADLERVITTDLANDLGNLLNRMMLLAHKQGMYEILTPQTWSAVETALLGESWTMLGRVQENMATYHYHMALADIWKFIAQVNAYFHAQEPWRLAQHDPVRFQQVLSATAHSLYTIAITLWPFMPQKMEELLNRFGSVLPTDDNVIEHLATGIWKKSFLLKQGEPLFKKYEPVAVEKTKEDKAVQEQNYIAIDDFTKVE